MAEEKEILLIDEYYQPVITEGSASAVHQTVKQFISSYAAHKDELTVEEWLPMELQASLPEESPQRIAEMSDSILYSLNIAEEKRSSLSRAVAQGRSKEFWLTGELKQAVSYISTQQATVSFQLLNDALANANAAMENTIMTAAETVNQNPCLDGFIAEQYHAQTFNLNATSSGSTYRAKVLEPNGAYGKNSVDLVIVDRNGKVVRRYQSKYCKDAKATELAFEHGDYRGQQKLVPSDQSQEIAKKHSTVIEAPDGTTSNSLTKNRAKELQKDAQSGNWKAMDWNEYQLKDLAVGVAHEAGRATLTGAAVGTGFYLAEKVWNGEKIDCEEVVETAITSGSDFGIKAAASGALQVCSEKGIVPLMPKGTNSLVFGNIAFVAVENAKVMGKVAAGELTLQEGLDKMEQTTVSTIVGIEASFDGKMIGAIVGSTFGPIGTVIGGLVGGTVGYMAGSKFGRMVTNGVQTVRGGVGNAIRSVGNGLKNVGKAFHRMLA